MSESRRRLDTTLKGRATTTLLAVAAVLMAFVGALALPSIAASQGISPTATITPGDIGPPTATPTPTMPLDGLDGDDNEEQVKGLFFEIEGDPPPSPDIDTLASRLAGIDFAQLDPSLESVSRPMGSDEVSRLTPQTVSLNLFDDATFTGRIEHVEPTSSGYAFWGGIDGVELGTMTMVVNRDIVVGTVRTPGGVFTVETADSDAYVIRQIDESTLPLLAEPLESLPDSDKGLRQTLGDSVPMDDGSVIDLMAVYTPAAKSLFGGRAGIEALIDLYVAETNQAYASSGAFQRIRLVLREEVDYVESSWDDIGRLEGDSDGYMDHVHELRDAYAADLVHLIFATNEEYEYAGVANFEGPFGASLAAPWAGWVFAHELGHNMGLHHDRYQLMHERGTETIEGSFFGYVNQRAFESGAPESARWRTIMSYDRQCGEVLEIFCRQLLFFSNPRLTYGGDPMGVSVDNPSTGVDGPADAVRTLNERRGITANFRSSASSTPRVGLALSRYRLSEMGDTGTATATLHKPSSEDTKVTISAWPTSAVTLSKDRTLIIPAGQTVSVGVVTITTVDNDDQTGSVKVTVSAAVTNASEEGVVAPHSVTLYVIDDDTDIAPAFEAGSVAYTFTAGEEDIRTLPEATGGNGSLTYSISPAPGDGVTFVSGPPARLEVSATSVASGETNYTLTATDSDGDTDEMTVSITVRSSNCAGSAAVSGYSGDGIVADCEVLLASRDALRGEQSLNWSEDLSIDEWEGVRVGSDRVVDLTIREYGLSGSLPAELGDLTHLKTLALSHNELSGPIPPELGSLSRLETLWLGKSQLTGRIPPELGNLSSLETLWLGSNQLIGRIPSELGNLSNLETLWLANNRLSGPIPPELGSLSRLETLWLAFSELSGSIPPELGGLSNLEFLWLGDNQLTGRIPPELGDLANLKKLYLDNNRLSGPIPPELNKLTSLEQLYIGGNQFSGCAADVLFDVPVNDLRESGIRSCNEQLSGLTISPGSLVPPFNPDHTSYTAVVGQAQITISPTYGSNVTLQILDQDGNAIVDADRSLAGHQIDLDAGVTVVSLRLSTREGNETSGHYTIWVNRASAPGAPVIEGITPGGQSLTVAWNAPAETGGADIASYDLRYIESGSADKSDDNWTVIADAWTRGPRRYTITGLDADTSYDAQVRAVHGAGAGPWSETSSGTPIALAGTCLEYITGPIIIYGTWDGECESTVRTGSYARFYTFTLGELKEMAITLESEADTYLYVREGEGPDGHIVYDDDDDDHLMFNLTSSTDSGISESIESGTYTIEATTHDPGKRGTFTLTLPDIDFSEQNDRAALVALYQATNGHNWVNRANWLTYAPLGEWHGVTTDSSGRVTGLALVQNRLSGHISPELADLATVESIDLRINGLTGEIPARLGELAELESLDLGLNLLEGTIPEELAKLSNLKSLNLAGNNLSGTIPPELGSLDNLEYLNLAVNGLTGEIPHELGNLDQLESLRLHNNQLSGTIPPELSNLGSLAELLLLENLLAGPLPPELGKLSNLEFLDIGFNKLTGTIPPEFGDLASLGALFLYRNELSGMIPSELSNLSNLHGLNLNNNSLSGTIPPELGDMPNLVSLHVNDNELSGEIPPELGKSPSLGFLVLNNNQLSGQIPSELGNLENLIALFVADNQLTGCIPYTLRDVQENDFDQLDLPFCENPDRAALVALYHATNGQSWDESDNWLTDAPLDDWDHVRTDDYGRVVDLSLGGNDLIGHIPPELGDLSKLKFLELDGNLLTGTLPPELGKLVNLVELFLEENRLTGTIPSEFGNLVALERLYLNENRFWGELPFSMTALSELRRFEFDDNSAGLCAPADAGFQEWLNSVEDVDGDTCVHPTSPPDEREIAALTAIYNATDGDNWYDRTNWFSDEPVQFWSGISVDSEGHITELRLWGNNLSGQIPTELSHLTSLKRLYLSSNEFTGTIPEELGSLTGLERLYLGRNQLTGTMPPSLGNLTNLRRLYLSGNQLTGSIPPEIGNLTALELLYLYDNNLTGSIPPALGNLNSLKELLILGNELSGHIPPELGQMQDMRVLRISDNRLEGPIPPELSDLDSLESLDLSSNRLTGEFPSGLVDLQKLHGLNLADNRLSGELPSQIGDFEDLVTLRLDDNQFTGSIPRELGELTTLWNLHLARNQFSSEIPQELGNLENLKRLDLSSNQLTGTIPPELGKLSISDLNLSGNQLSGAISNAFGKLFHMNYLDLSNNQLTDTIPAELRYLGMNSFNGLEVLLGNNQLTGPVPPELGDLADLKVLEINDNLLSGQLPRELTNLKILASLQFNNNAGLCAPYDVVFQDWLKSIPQVIGDTCGSGPVETDREALVALYKATDGDNWGNNINWLSDAPLLEWYGITTDGGGRVTEIDLYLNQLSGQIPPELGELAHLKSLSIASNSSRITVNGLSSSGLTGQIPPELGKLSNLVELHLYQNDLTGEIPPELGKLVNLEELHLASNELIGEIPEELGDLRNLVELSLYQNDLTGEIPAELGNLANLEALGLYSNRLAGEIPPQLGDLGKLVELDLFQNRLTSEIPSSIGKLGNLERLSLYRNQLTGIIPFELGRLANLKYLELGENQLTGIISPEFGNLTELKILDLHSNPLTGSIPAELSKLHSLQILDLGGNGLSGEIPPELAGIETLTELHLWGNDLIAAGFLSRLSGMTSLEALNLSDNRIVGGDVLPHLAGLPNLTFLGLRGTQLKTDQLLPFIEDLRGLRHLVLSDNLLTGDRLLPTIAGFDSLEHLSLGNNELTGVIPLELGNQHRLRGLLLGGNHMTGEVPTGLGNLPILSYLYVNDNFLTGELPQSLTHLNLAGLRFQNNAGLCAPDNEEFQGWLQSVRDVQGDTCGVAPPDTQISIPEHCIESLNGGAVTDAWTNECLSLNRTENDLHYARYYSFTLDRRTTIELTLESNTDPYLILLSENGEVLAQDDDDDEGAFDLLDRNSGIRLVLDPGDYIVEATTYEGAATGDFTLMFRRPELDALYALYKATNGDSWKNAENWLADAPFAEWHGVRTDDEGRIIAISLGDNNLKGEIPPELGRLSQLEWLSLANNELSGPIPAELGDLENLRILVLFNNDLTGPIPYQFGELQELLEMYLERNRLSGPIPAQLGNLRKLYFLNLTDNGLSGSIPSAIGNLQELRDLHLAANALSGPIPGDIGDLRKLRRLNIRDNDLTGGDFIDLRLDDLDDLSFLDIGGNLIDGRDVLFQVHELFQLSGLGLYDSGLTDSDLRDYMDIIRERDLGFFDISANELSDPQILEGLSRMSTLSYLHINDNDFSGELPQTMTGLTHMQRFHFHDNDGLCAPTDDEFQDWLAGIRDVRGDTCP